MPGGPPPPASCRTTARIQDGGHDEPTAPARPPSRSSPREDPGERDHSKIEPQQPAAPNGGRFAQSVPRHRGIIRPMGGSRAWASLMSVVPKVPPTIPGKDGSGQPRRVSPVTRRLRPPGRQVMANFSHGPGGGGLANEFPTVSRPLWEDFLKSHHELPRHISRFRRKRIHADPATASHLIAYLPVASPQHTCIRTG